MKIFFLHTILLNFICKCGRNKNNYRTYTILFWCNNIWDFIYMTEGHLNDMS